MPEGETPHHIQLCAFEEHVDYVRPGDRVEVVGIYRAVGVRANNARRVMKNIFQTYIDVVSYKKTDKRRLGFETETAENEEDAVMQDIREKQIDGDVQEFIKFSEEDVQKIKDFSRDPRCYEKLVDALAPSIWENDDVKKGVLC